MGCWRFWGRCLNMLIEGLSLSPTELSSPCQRLLRCGHTIWVSVSLPRLGDHHALQLHSGFCCESLRLSHGLCKSPIASHQGIGSFSRFLDLKLRKPIADLDLIDKDRINKTKVRWLRSKWPRIELTIKHTCYFFHFRTLIAGPLASTFEMMASHGFWNLDKTLFNSREQGNNGL